MNRRFEVSGAMEEESWGTLLFCILLSVPKVRKIMQEDSVGKFQGHSFSCSSISFQFLWQMNSIFFLFFFFFFFYQDGHSL